MAAWPLQCAIYGAGDAGAGGAFPALQSFLWRQLNDLGRVVTTDRVAGLAQLDSVNAPSMRWVLDPRGRTKPQTMPDTNTGDPAQLVEFAQWCERTCPAERHVLVLSGHGLAFQDSVTNGHYGRGVAEMGAVKRAKSLFRSRSIGTRAILMDESDFLTVPEMRGALAAIAASYPSRRIDTLVFDACLMSNVELMYELADIAGAVVGAVDEISGAGLNLAGAAQILHRDAPTTPSAIAAAFVTAYEPHQASDSCIAVELDRTRLDEATAAFAEFSTLLLTDIGASRELARLCRDALASSSRELVCYRSKSLADIGAVLIAMREIGLAQRTLAALDAAVRTFASLIVGRRVGADYANAIGLSVFAPSSIEQYRINVRDYEGLAFSRRTRWAEVLEQLYGLPAPASLSLKSLLTSVAAP